MANLASRFGMIALLAGAGLAFAWSQGQSVTDLDEFSDERLRRDLEDELEDIYYDTYYGHDQSYMDEEIDLEVLYDEIMYALSDAGDGEPEYWDGEDSWDDDDEDLWEGEEDWDGEEIGFADLEAEMLEAGTTLEDVVWEALDAAATDDVASRRRAPHVVSASIFSLSPQRGDVNRKGKPKTAISNTASGIQRGVRAAR